MKKIVLVIFLLTFCFSAWSCRNNSRALPPLSDNEKEIVELENPVYIYGIVREKISSDVLLLELCSPYYVNEWGEKVYVISSTAYKWELGVEVEVEFSKAERPLDKKQYVRIEADSIDVPVRIEKPIIYLYPEVPTECSVKIKIDGALSVTYPEYSEGGWQGFVAYPDGTLVFPDGKEYYALYWEAMQSTEWDFSEGFCVRGEDTASFLEWVLAEQGLTPREANEFIIYWLPQMQNNPYNVISFQKESYTDTARLEISPAPDSILRVFMAYYSAESEVEIPPQSFEPVTREGFTVVEWGGSLTE